MGGEVLNEKKCLEILVRCIVKGQTKGVFSIKDASLLYKIINHLSENKKDEELEKSGKKNVYDALGKGVILAHDKGVFTLDESAVIDQIFEWLVENDIISSKKEESTKEEPKKESKIKEI
jgi:hypothetical protein